MVIVDGTHLFDQIGPIPRTDHHLVSCELLVEARPTLTYRCCSNPEVRTFAEDFEMFRSARREPRADVETSMIICHNITFLCRCLPHTRRRSENEQLVPSPHLAKQVTVTVDGRNNSSQLVMASNSNITSFIWLNEPCPTV